MQNINDNKHNKTETPSDSPLVSSDKLTNEHSQAPTKLVADSLNKRRRARTSSILKRRKETSVPISERRLDYLYDWNVSPLSQLVDYIPVQLSPNGSKQVDIQKMINNMWLYWFCSNRRVGNSEWIVRIHLFRTYCKSYHLSPHNPIPENITHFHIYMCVYYIYTHTKKENGFLLSNIYLRNKLITCHIQNCNQLQVKSDVGNLGKAEYINLNYKGPDSWVRKFIRPLHITMASFQNFWELHLRNANITQPNLTCINFQVWQSFIPTVWMISFHCFPIQLYSGFLLEKQER